MTVKFIIGVLLVASVIRLATGLLAEEPAIGADPARAFTVAAELQLYPIPAEALTAEVSWLDLDEQGRVWLLEVPSASPEAHSGVAQAFHGRLRILQNTASVVYEDPILDGGETFCVLGKRVIVSTASSIWILTDRDRDGRADQRDLLFSGSGVGQVSIGPDGALYFSAGDTERSIFRSKLDGTQVEKLARDFGSTPALDVDCFGTVWAIDCDQSGGHLDVVLAGGAYGVGDRRLDHTGTPRKRSDPGIVPSVVEFRNGAPTGLFVYEGRTLPKRFWNCLMVCDPAQHEVCAWIASPLSAGSQVTNEVLVSSSDPEFCPRQGCVAPDGSVYVLSTASGKGNATVQSRIYRVARKNSKPSLPPQDWTGPHGWVGALQSGNRATRNLAWSNLHAAGAAAERDLLILTRSLDLTYKARTFQILARIEGKEDQYIGQCLQNTNASLRLLGLRLAQQEQRDVLPLIAQVGNDPSPLVRREEALLLRDNTAAEAAELWTTLALQLDASDRLGLEALGIGADGQWDRFLDEWLAKVGSAWKHPPGPEIVWRSRALKTPSLLRELIREGGSREEQAAYRRALELMTESENAGPQREREGGR